jgi:hypothetical protein
MLQSLRVNTRESPRVLVGEKFVKIVWRAVYRSSKSSILVSIGDAAPCLNTPPVAPPPSAAIEAMAGVWRVVHSVSITNSVSTFRILTRIPGGATPIRLLHVCSEDPNPCEDGQSAPEAATLVLVLRNSFLGFGTVAGPPC